MEKTTLKKTWWVPLVSLLAVTALAVVSPDTPADDPTPAQGSPAAPPPAEPPPVEPPPVEPQEDTTDDSALETFVPSEKLPADSAISFPVDI